MATARQIQALVKRIEREVDEAAGTKAADTAVKAFILAVPLKRGVGPSKKEMREYLLRERGADDKAYIDKALRDSVPGAFVRADDATRYQLFEGDAVILFGDNDNTENVGQVIYLHPEDIILSRAKAVDGNMEHFDPADAADAIIQTYAYDVEGGGRGAPWFPTPRSRGY